MKIYLDLEDGSGTFLLADQSDLYVGGRGRIYADLEAAARMSLHHEQIYETIQGVTQTAKGVKSDGKR